MLCNVAKVTTATFGLCRVESHWSRIWTHVNGFCSRFFEVLYQMVDVDIQALTIPQLRCLSSLIEESIRHCNEERAQCETERNDAMFEIGNLLHESVIVSADEVRQLTFN